MVKMNLSIPYALMCQNIDYKFLADGDQLIFDEQGENPSWNGKYSDDQLCTEDSYEYLINYRTLDGSWRKRKGVVYLIR